MLTIGSRVFWIGNSLLRWGEVVAINARRHIDERPKQIVVDDGTDMSVMNAEYGQKWFEDAAQAVADYTDASLQSMADYHKTVTALREALKRIPPEVPAPA